MKHVLLFGLMLASFLSYSQYPASGAKQRLGWQTTGDGLVYRGAIADTSTLDPSGLNNAWMLLDTVSGNLYAYRIKAWRLVSGGGGGGITMPLDSVAFNTSYVSGFPTGTMAYDADNETVSVGIDGGAIYQLGQELFYPVVVNKSDSLIKNGQLVMVDTATLIEGDRVRVIQARNGANYPSNYIMGVATTDIPNDSTGLVTFFGYVREVKHADIAQSGDTLVPGNILYPSPTQPGRYTNVPPSTPAHKSTIALVVRKPNPNNMTLLVRPWLAPKLEDASDVDTAGITQNSVLRYDTASGYWKASTTAGIVAGDTAAMLTNYINVADTATMLTNYVNIADTATMLSSYISNADTSVFARDWQIAGTTNYLPKFTGASSVGNSPLYNPSGNKIMLGHTSPNLLTTSIELHSASSTTAQAQSSVDIYMGNSLYADYTPYLQLYRNRSSTVGGLTRVNNGDWLGRITFQGADNLKYVRGAQIYALTDGATNTDLMPTALRFATNPGNQFQPLDRMSITSAGLVGIGTTTPDFKLSVLGADSCCGTPRISAQFADGLNSAFYVAHTGPHPTPGYATLLGSSDDLAFGQIQSGGTSEYMRIKASTGRVGIGTSSPGSYLLNLRDSIGFSGNGMYFSSTNGGTANPGGHIIGTKRGSWGTRIDFVARDAAGSMTETVMSIDGEGGGGGNVGINTSSPSRPLHVNATSAVRIPVGTTVQRPSAGANGDIRYNSTNTNFEWYSGSGWREPVNAARSPAAGLANRFSKFDASGLLDTSAILIQANNRIGIFNSPAASDSTLTVTGGIRTTTSISTNSDATINNIRIGKGSGNVSSNIVIGLDALVSNTSGGLNIAIGNKALRDNLTAGSNSAIGGEALMKNTTGIQNTAIASYTLSNNTTGNNNTAIGSVALYNNTGSSNTAIGAEAMRNNTTGTQNTAISSYALFSNTTSSNNTAVGSVSLYANTGSDNSAIGAEAMRNSTTGIQNTAVGSYGLFSNTTGSNNTAVGSIAMYNNTTGSNNTAIGVEAGRFTNSGTNNQASTTSIYIGNDARPSASGNSNEIVIAYQGRGNGSNTTTIGNSSTTNTVIPAGSLTVDVMRRKAPVTVTGNHTVADGTSWLICNGTAAIALTLPAASSWTGREIMVKTVQPQAVTSASSNVVPIDGTATGTAILPATDGAWCTLVSDGTNWIIMQRGN